MRNFRGEHLMRGSMPIKLLLQYKHEVVYSAP